MYTECYREALEIQRITDDILRDHFFDDVRELTIMPQNNQVLLKREKDIDKSFMQQLWLILLFN